MADERGGKAPGRMQFQSETGITPSDWFPKYWLRWSEAIREAGCSPNAFNAKFDDEYVLTRLIELIRELGHYPVKGELIRKRRTDSSFPSPNVFSSSIGGKDACVKKLLAYCSTHSGFDDIPALCSELPARRSPRSESQPTDASSCGYVYLVRHGSRNEYKIGRTTNLLRREGEIGIELPEKGEPVHTIKTDDPAGVERYWHHRYKDQRKNGEWFALTANDVRAFKRWKRIY